MFPQRTVPSSRCGPVAVMDLASLACGAAMEIDALILGRKPSLTAVPQLRDRITKTVVHVDQTSSKASLLNPTMAWVIHSALRPTEQQDDLDQLAEQTRRITEQLDQVTADPEKYRETSCEQLKDIRSFCVALSREALISHRSFQKGRPGHPFRR
ncbi:MAG: hypothetical protein AB1714_10020 [Acidobacteriota bacterium]